MEEIHTEEIDLKDPKIQDRITEIEAERGDSVVTQILCRKVMRLESTVDQLIRAMVEAEIIEIEERPEEDDDVRS